MRYVIFERNLSISNMKKTELKKLFRLPREYVLDNLREQEGASEVYCHSKTPGMWHEGEYSKTVSERRIRRVKHIMIEDTQVVLVITQRRFRFHQQKTCRWEKLPGIESCSKTSNEFQKNTLRELQTQNYSQSGKKRDVAIVTP